MADSPASPNFWNRFRDPRQPAEQPRKAPPPPEDPSRPVITVRVGQRPKAADDALEAMFKAGVPFYQRDRQLVRAAMAKAKTSDGKAIEIPVIVEVTKAILGRAMGATAEWQRVLKSGEISRVDPPREVVEMVADMFGDWPFPPLNGLITTQTMRPDGSILDQPGYDEATGLLLLNPPSMPRIPDQPTRLDADRAIENMQTLFTEFPFAGEPARAVALSMAMTTVLRAALAPAVPTHAASAPTAGTGKSYLADIAAALATGERCPVIAVAPAPEETEKRLIAAALAGFQIIALDNVTGTLGGDFLNQVTERPMLQLRPLGSSAIVRVANTFTVFANGNNLSAPIDMIRRTLVCRLDADLENPEERSFNRDPVADVIANRGRFVADCLTIARAYIVAGSPGRLRSLPSYERWSDLVRSSLVWLGCADPCVTMDLARADDPERTARTAFFRAWEAEITLGHRGFVTTELMRFVNAVDGQTGQPEYPLFRAACLEVAGDHRGQAVSAVWLARWMTKNNDNRVGNLKLIVNRSDPHRPKWIMTSSN